MLRRWIVGSGLVLLTLGLARALPSPENLLELRQRTPNFESKVGRALLRVQAKNPGLVPGLARHLIEDLGEEPMQALIDLHTDLRARYPHFDEELAGLIEQGKQGRQQFRQRFPRLRSWFLGRVQALPEQPPKAVAYLAQHHPKLLVGLAFSASRLVDEKYPELPAEWNARPDHQGPLPFMLTRHPDFLSQLVSSLSPEQRREIRQAAAGILQEREAWAKRQPPGRLQEGFEALLTQFPGIAESWGENRSQQVKRRLEKFPELRQVVWQSLQSKHPALLEKARQSVDRNYPELRQQVREALKEEEIF